MNFVSCMQFMATNVTFEQMKEYLPLLIPFIILEWAMAIAALIHIWKHDHYKFGNRIVWSVVVLLIQLIGPIIYFAFGKGDES